jgi:hypothetical protein
MALKPGQVLVGGYCAVTYEAGETVSPGDVVGISGGQLRAVNSGDSSPNPIGVVGDGGGADSGEDYNAGEEVPVVTSAESVLANVASGVSAGEELGPSATDGELAAGGGFATAFTDEGGAAGLSTNEDVPAGLAGVEY